MVTHGNLALKEPEFKDGDGGGDGPAIVHLPMTEEEALYLFSIVQGCAFDDEEAVSLRNRLNVLLFNSPVRLVVDNTK